MTYTYNRLGRIATVSDVLGERTLAYSTKLMPATETFDAAGDLAGKRITTDYQDTVSYGPPGEMQQLFAFARLEAVEVGTSGDPDADYRAAYDYSGDTGRMTKLTAGPGLPAGGVAYTYWTGGGGAAAELVDKIEYIGGGSSVVGTVDFAYESARDLIQSVTNYWGGTDPEDIVSRYAYVNDSLARRTSVVRSGSAFDGAGGASDEHADVWSYNPRNELIESERFEDTDDPFDQNNVPGLDREFTYDPIGNRKTYVEGTAATKYYCANQLNQYDTIDDDSSDCPPSGPDESFSYDLDGNLTACNNTAQIAPGSPVRQVALSWDAENRLISVAPSGTSASGDKKVEFEYDYMGRRVSKKVTAWDPALNGGAGGWATTPSLHRRFMYHNWLYLVELDALDSNAVETKWTWGLDLAGQRGQPDSIDSAAGIGGLLAIQDTNGTTTGENPEADDDSFAFFYDANGNVGQLVDISDGSLGARYEYDAYGNVMFSYGAYASENKIRFSTKYWDDETGLGYWGYRYYEPITGRWTSRDPIGERGGWNLQQFASGATPVVIDSLGAATMRAGCAQVATPEYPPAPTDPKTCKDYKYTNPKDACRQSPPGEGRGWVECKDHKPVVCLTPGQRNFFGCILYCLWRHEQMHVLDLPKDACENKCDGFYLGLDDAKAHKRSECRAMKEELKCVLGVDCGVFEGKNRDRCEDSRKIARRNLCSYLLDMTLSGDCDFDCQEKLKHGELPSQSP